MNLFERKFRDLNKYIRKLNSIYVDKYVGQVIGPNIYEFDVRSYCILAHAAFEEYFEYICTVLYEDCIDKYISNNKFSQITIGLLATNCNDNLRMIIDDDNSNAETDAIVYLKTLIGNIKPRMENIVKRNNGISPKFIRRLLLPNTVNILNTVAYINSLNELAKHRGDYAHNMMITRPLAPEDAKNYVNDVMLICEDSKNQAKVISRRYYNFI